jgi:hypothetical protein
MERSMEVTLLDVSVAAFLRVAGLRGLAAVLDFFVVSAMQNFLLKG